MEAAAWLRARLSCGRSAGPRPQRQPPSGELLALLSPPPKAVAAAASNAYGGGGSLAAAGARQGSAPSWRQQQQHQQQQPSFALCVVEVSAGRLAQEAHAQHHHQHCGWAGGGGRGSFSGPGFGSPPDGARSNGSFGTGYGGPGFGLGFAGTPVAAAAAAVATAALPASLAATGGVLVLVDGRGFEAALAAGASAEGAAAEAGQDLEERWVGQWMGVCGMISTDALGVDVRWSLGTAAVARGSVYGGGSSVRPYARRPLHC